jgi:hypothetical protein
VTPANLPAFRPSGLNLRCPASLVLGASAPPRAGSEATALGSFFHRAVGHALAREPFATETLAAEFGVEMERATILVATARKLARELPFENWQTYIELEMKLSFEAPGGELLWMLGHLDRIAVAPDGSALHVDDYKSGYCDCAPPDENSQMWLYLIMAKRWAEKLHRQGVLPQSPSAFSGQLHYPRLKSTSQLVKFAGEQLELIYQGVQAYALKALGPSPEYRMGPWCRFCPAKFRCVPNMAAFSEAVRQSQGRNWVLGESNPIDWIAPAVDLARRMREAGEQLEESSRLAIESQGLNAIRLADGSLYRKHVRSETKGHFPQAKKESWRIVRDERKISK